MADQHIRFQQGMSIPEFLRGFGTETQFAEAVMQARWSAGFQCPRCSVADHYVVGHGARRLWQCQRCRHQTSLTAGSLMEHTKLRLTTWFLATYLISQAKTGLSALALKRQLGVSYPTAWLLHQKINRAMAQQDATHRLSGDVRIDDAYLGGERSGGKAGRGSENKVPFVAAVSTNEQGHSMYLKLHMVSGVTSEAISRWAKANLLPGSTVISEGLARFAAVVNAGCVHEPRVVGGLKPRELPEFKWVNTVLGNLKPTLAGAFHALKYRKYGQRYLAAFVYRFNRRFNLRDLVARAIVDMVRAMPFSESAARAPAEACF